MSMRRGPRGQQGFLIIAAVFLLVVLAGLAAYLSTVSSTSQAASAADVNSARAYQAARAGAEWAVYLVLRGPTGAGTLRTDCEGGSTTKTLSPGSTLAAFTVTVSCTATTFSEGGGASTFLYRITSNACNEPNAGACPNASTTSATYVEREVSSILSQ